jgi:hypothetical protein
VAQAQRPIAGVPFDGELEGGVSERRDAGDDAEAPARAEGPFDFERELATARAA